MDFNEWLKTRILSCGFLKLTGWCSDSPFIVPKPYRYEVASYINSVNVDMTMGSLNVGDDVGFSFSIETSLLDGAVEDMVYTLMELLLISVLEHHKKPIYSLSAGIIPREDDSESSELPNMPIPREPFADKDKNPLFDMEFDKRGLPDMGGSNMREMIRNRIRNGGKISSEWCNLFDNDDEDADDGVFL